MGEKRKKSAMQDTGRMFQVGNLQAQFGNNEKLCRKRTRNAGMVQGEVHSNTREAVLQGSPEVKEVQASA